MLHPPLQLPYDFTFTTTCHPSYPVNDEELPSYDDSASPPRDTHHTYERHADRERDHSWHRTIVEDMAFNTCRVNIMEKFVPRKSCCRQSACECCMVRTSGVYA